MTASRPVRVSIVVPSRNRHELLKKCVDSIAHNVGECAAEIIVVDDGSRPPVTSESFPPGVAATLIRLEGRGPAAARNAGVQAARGEVVLFTDDDVVASATWVTAALDYLDSHPRAVGVTGPIRSVPWDPLYEHSIATDSPGAYWTCNIAYRRAVMVAMGGFRSDVFVHAHAEDRDFALRALMEGDIGFAPTMEVTHAPRRIALRDIVRQAHWARDDLTLYALHPHLTADFALPARLALVLGSGRTWLRFGFVRKTRPSAKRVLRALGATGVAMTATAWAVVRVPTARQLRRDTATDSLERMPSVTQDL